jgi:ParB/RepB/Spo0J family partition protein
MDTIDLSKPAVHFIALDRIFAQPQVRTVFDDDSLAELATSIKQHGMLQPLLLRPVGEDFCVIAGERRLRAAHLAGLTHVPAFAGEIDPDHIDELQLIENIQREALSMLDTAAGVTRLVKKHGKLQPVAELLGKSLSWISKQVTASEKLGYYTQQAAGEINDLETLLVMNQIERLGKWFPRGMNLVQKIADGKAGRQEARDLLAALKAEASEDRKEKKAKKQKALDLEQPQEPPKWNAHHELDNLISRFVNNAIAPEFDELIAHLDKDQVKTILSIEQGSFDAGKKLAKKDEATKLYNLARLAGDYPSTEEEASFIMGMTGQAYTLQALLESCRRVHHG